MRAGGRVVAAALLVAGLLPAGSAAADRIALERVVEGLDRPVVLTHAGDGSGRLFVAEQGGRIRILRQGQLRGRPFLDISDRISCCGEQGLLGLAFHPAYSENGLFFVNYTDRRGGTVVSRFSVGADPEVADPGSEVEVLSFAQPFSNHNGGALAFGPDGYLYIASGDGGSAGDPRNNGQALDTLLGKILRLDVETLPARIPPDNPFVGRAEARGEIWAYGLRNPWRISFDRVTGDLFIADVGQNDLEEVDFQPAASPGGENYGWRRMEGTACFEPASGCDDGSLVLPIHEYSHALGCSITGGYRYRGREMPELAGTYLFGDFCSGLIWGAADDGEGGWGVRELAASGLTLSSFGEDEAGEIYALHHSLRSGAVYRVTRRLIFADGFESGDVSSWRRRRPRRLSVVEPGLEGSSFALKVALAGDDRPSYLRAVVPRRQESLVLRFTVDAGEADPGGGEIDVVSLAGRSGDRAVVALERAGRRVRAILYALDERGARRRVGRVRLPARRAVRLAVQWTAPTAPGAEDGALRLFRNGRLRASRENLASDDPWIRQLRVGLPGGAPADASGHLLLDEFELTP